MKALDRDLEVVDGPCEHALEHALLLLGHFLSLDEVFVELCGEVVNKELSQVSVGLNCVFDDVPLILALRTHHNADLFDKELD